MEIMATGFIVNCTLADCVHYHQEPADSVTRCMHKDRAFYSKTAHCPLYQLDWAKRNLPVRLAAREVAE